MTELKPPTTEELLNVLRVHADAYPDSLSPFDVTEALVPPRPAPDGSPEQQLQQEQVLRVLQVHHHAVKAEYLAETVPATGEQGSRFGLTTPGMRWLDTNEPDESAEDGSEDEPIIITPAAPLAEDDGDSTPIHNWAFSGHGFDTWYLSLYVLLAMFHRHSGAAPEEIGEIDSEAFLELANRPGESPSFVQEALVEFERLHLLIRRDGRWLFSQLAAVLYDAGHDDETVRQQVEAAVASWIQEHAA